MITQCPSCQTRFRLPLDQVATSRGEVLCGECRAQFNALDYLVIEEGIKPGKPTLTMRATQGDERESGNTLFLPIDEDVIANLLSNGPAADSPTSDESVPVAEKRNNESSPQLTPIVQSRTPTITDTLLQQTLHPPVEDKVEEKEEEKVEIRAHAKTAKSTPTPKYQLSQELEESSGQPHPTLWSLLLSTVLIGLLTMTLGLQYLLVQRDHFSQHPYFRTVLTTLCPTIGCSVAPRRDLSRLSIVNNRVETHPHYANTLQISAELRNRGSFEQYYPIVELVMTNIQQEVVASRSFYPDEYLTVYSEGGTERFAGNSSNQLLLEVIDPGSHATGFEFILHNNQFPK